MHSTHLFVFALTGALAFVGLGCSTTQSGRQADDFRSALLAAITHIEGQSAQRASDASRTPLTLVVSSATPEPLRRACRVLRPTVYDYDLPDTNTLSLPSRHLQPQSLLIDGDTAVFKGVLGPVPLPGTPASRYDCGTTYQLRLVRQADGSWRFASGSDEFCGFFLPSSPHRAA